MSENLNVLVIGGAGYIGSHTALALTDAGYFPVIYDNFSTGHRDSCFGIATVDGELEDKSKLFRAFREHSIGSVIHFAALSEAGQSVDTPFPYFQNNVAATLTLLEVMQKLQVDRIVFSSTASVYGDTTMGEPINETTEKKPINPYGHSKAMVETILEAMTYAYGLHATVLRYFNAAGADPHGRSGERHDPETHLVPLVIQAAMGKRKDICIYGTNYDTPDGTCVRDYVHVSDLASGHVAALKRMLKKNIPSFEAFNLGTGKGHSVREVINAVRAVSGVNFSVIDLERRLGDPRFLIADATKARKILNWEPQNSELTNIVSDAWRYAKMLDSKDVSSTK